MYQCLGAFKALLSTNKPCICCVQRHCHCLLSAVQIEERDKDKRRVLKKIRAEHTSKSKMKDKMLVRITQLNFVNSLSAVLIMMTIVLFQPQHSFLYFP